MAHLTEITPRKFGNKVANFNYLLHVLNNCPCSKKFYVALRSDLDFFADLIPKEVAEKWLKYLREELPTVAFKCSTQQQRSNLGHTRKSKSLTMTSTTSECLGAETLLQLLKNYSRNNKVKKTAPTISNDEHTISFLCKNSVYSPNCPLVFFFFFELPMADPGHRAQAKLTFLYVSNLHNCVAF
jgi:hypothetical protein